MLLGDLGKEVFLKAAVEGAKTKKEKDKALKAVRDFQKQMLGRYRKDGTLKSEYRKSGGYTVTNRFSDRMLPEKKKTTRIT